MRKVLAFLLAATAACAAPPGEPVVGLVLSGGGARGIAHIGVIIAFEEAGVPIDLVTGTSMGSIIGGLYAAGYTGQEMRGLVSEVDWDNLFDAAPAPGAGYLGERRGILPQLLELRYGFWDLKLPSGLINSQRVYENLLRLTAGADYASGGDFDQLAVPYRCMTVDITSGALLTQADGSLARAMQASLAIPLLFEPVRYRGRLLVDGGVLNVLPTDVARELGADIVIGVELQRMSELGTEPRNIVEVGRHTIEIMVGRIKAPQLAAADILIQPDLGRHETMTYSGLDSLITLGYEAGRAALDSLATILPRAHWTGDRRRAGDRAQLAGARVASVQVAGNRVVRTRILADFGLKIGDAFDLDQALDGIRHVYAAGFFKNVWLDIGRPRAGAVDLTVTVEENEPRSLNLGVNWQSDLDARIFVQAIHYNLLGLDERFMPSLRLGAVEDRVDLDVVGNVIARTALLWHLSGGWFRTEPWRYDGDGRRLDRMRWSGARASGVMGVHLGRQTLLSAGATVQRDWEPARTTEHTYLDLELARDGRDRLYLPTCGVFSRLAGRESIAGAHLRQGAAELEAHWSAAPGHVLSLFGRLDVSQGDLPLEALRRAGGPLAIPGRHRQELWGAQAASLGAGYRLRLRDWIWPAVYFCGGNVFDRTVAIRGDALLFGVTIGLLGATPLGPASLLYSRGDDGRDSLDASVGYAF